MEEKISILIVDDSASLVRTMSFVLRRRGYSVATAEDGQQAVAMTGERHFDIVFMDVKVPLLDGVETYRRMKKIRPEATVVMITAYAVEQQVEGALEEGACAVIHKPLEIEKVVSLIEGAHQGKEGAFILIIDDDSLTSIALKKVLARGGYRTSIAHTGEQAIEMVRHNTHDIILIDAKLPSTNGLETYLRIKKIQPDVAVILMTAYRQEMFQLVEKALENNAYACLYKPFAMEELLKLVDKIRARKQKAISAEGSKR